MGSAVWEFMWLMDKVTKIDDKGWGWVLGGKPIKLKEMADDMNFSENAVGDNLTRLEKEGYIKKIIAPYGISIRVAKAKKRFQRNSIPLSKEVPTKLHTSPAKLHTSNSENSIPNKTVSVRDKVEDNNNTTSGKTAIQLVIHYFFERKGWVYKGTPAEIKLFGRFTRPAKDLLALCEGDVPAAKECISKISEWAKSHDLDWSIETVFKKWYEIDLLKPKEKKPYYDGARIFQKNKDGKWWIVRPDGIKELGIWPKKEQILWK